MGIQALPVLELTSPMARDPSPVRRPLPSMRYSGPTPGHGLSIGKGVANVNRQLCEQYGLRVTK